jgi:hypothetical protein
MNTAEQKYAETLDAALDTIFNGMQFVNASDHAVVKETLHAHFMAKWREEFDAVDIKDDKVAASLGAMMSFATVMNYIRNNGLEKIRQIVNSAIVKRTNPNADLSNDELAAKLNQAIITKPLWTRRWCGSGADRGFSIVEGRKVIAYLGDVSGEEVDKIIAAHNNSFKMSVVVNPQLLADLSLPQDMPQDEKDDILAMVFGKQGNITMQSGDFENLAGRLGWER